MSSYSTFPANPTGVRLPYRRASTAQQAQAVAYLRQRLRHHFPALRPSTWARALADYQPDLWLTSPALTLAEADLLPLAQHLAAAPDLPVLDPPIYGLPALQLAQHSLRTSELAAGVLPELVAAARACGPLLHELLRRLVRPNPLAQQIVQAWCWNLASAPPLPPGIPGGGKVPGSPEVEQWLACLHSLTTSSLIGPRPASERVSGRKAVLERT